MAETTRVAAQLKEPHAGTHTDCAYLLDEALKPEGSLRQLFTATDSILALVERGLSGDAVSYAQYQTLLLDLHLPGEARTEPTRRWIASQIYQVEDKFAPQAADFQPLPVDAFRARVDEEIANRTRVRHPMSLHLFQGTPSYEEIKFFLHHHWIRSYNFYSLLAELAFRFEDIADASVFYRNLYGEAGAETPDRSHPALLAKLMEYFKIPLRIDFRSLHAQEKAYLNNRLRCVRHTDTAWGLSLLYAVESVSRTNHLRIYELLQRQRVPEEYCDFHRLHGTQDEIDTEELWQLISKFAGSGSFQRTFMQSLARHFEINRKYFDVLWTEMQGLSSKKV
jgi:pyrroloquinoline quinone (PQQ) biosynthesis protein C